MAGVNGSNSIPELPLSSLRQLEINEMMIIERLELESNVGLAAMAVVWAWAGGSSSTSIDVRDVLTRVWISSTVTCRHGMKSDTTEHIYSYRIVSKRR